VAAAFREALRAKQDGVSRAILFNLSGHGHFDMQAYLDYTAGRLQNYEYPEHEIAMALAGLAAGAREGASSINPARIAKYVFMFRPYRIVAAGEFLTKVPQHTEARQMLIIGTRGD